MGKNKSYNVRTQTIIVQIQQDGNSGRKIATALKVSETMAFQAVQYFREYSKAEKVPRKHTYIHNWLIQPFSQDFGPASHSTHVVRDNFICEWRDLQFNDASERQIF